MNNEKEILQEILLRIKSIETAIKDINDAGREPIHMAMVRAYHEGIDTGKKQVLDAMKQIGSDYSHNPQQNIYGKRKAFDRLPYFVEDVPAICGNCVNWEHQEFSNEGRCLLADEVRISDCLCNVVRD